MPVSATGGGTLGVGILAVFAGLAWWPAGTALGRLIGLGDAAAPLSAAASALIGAHIWRSARREAQDAMIGARRCSRCDAVLDTDHVDTRAGALGRGIDHVRCDRCTPERHVR